MIRGVVTARREAVVPLRVRGHGGTTDVDAVIDTGFSAALTLPPATVATLGLVRQSAGRVVLAGGSVVQFDQYTAEVEWVGTWRPVLMSAVGVEVLAGMRLLTGHELRVEVTPGGAVEVTPLPGSPTQPATP